jgi:hypothetical protein
MQSTAQMQENESQLTPPRTSHHIITTQSTIPITNPCRRLRAVVKLDIEEKHRRLGDGDLARLTLLVLRNDNGEQAVLHGCRDGVLVDTGRERKTSAEFPYAALRHPELGLGLLGLSGLLPLGNFGGTLNSTLILDSSLVALVTVCTLDGTLGRSALDEAGWWSTRGVAALGVAFDGQGVGVGEFDLHILLLNSGEFAVEFVGILEFLDVELGGEGL